MTEKLEAVERAAAQAAVSRLELEVAIRDAYVPDDPRRSLRAIAKAAKLSHEQVRRIVSR